MICAEKTILRCSMAGAGIVCRAPEIMNVEKIGFLLISEDGSAAVRDSGELFSARPSREARPSA
jgi:hypothetical protein